MPRPTPVTHFQHPELGLALRWLREQRAGLTRAEVAERSGAISQAYLRKLEVGERQALGRDKLELLLDVFGSSEAELEAILASSPWEGLPRDRTWKPVAGTPDPSAYRAAAADALADIADAGTWSTAVEDPAAATHIRGQATELVEHFVRLSAAERAEVLSAVRAKRYGGDR